MPPDGSQPEEAPSRISREKLPHRVREGHASHDPGARDTRVTPTATSYRPGVPDGRVPCTRPPSPAAIRRHNEHSGVTLTVTTANLVGAQNGG